ncbi:hypothetical protein [Aulosira sp. FACHB-615]|nr:hypothetical protein [Aulosira sp. FACHB-615]
MCEFLAIAIILIARSRFHINALFPRSHPHNSGLASCLALA